MQTLAVERDLVKLAALLRSVADKAVYQSIVSLTKQATPNQPPGGGNPSPPGGGSNPGGGGNPSPPGGGSNPGGGNPSPPGTPNLNTLPLSTADLRLLRDRLLRQESDRQLQTLDRLDRSLGSPTVSSHQRQVVAGRPLLSPEKSFFDRMGFSPEVAALGALGSTAAGIYLVKKILDKRKQQY